MSNTKYRVNELVVRALAGVNPQPVTRNAQTELKFNLDSMPAVAVLVGYLEIVLIYNSFDDR